MKKFSILQHSTLGYEAVKNGWSWPAFLFTWIWAFVKRLYLIGWIVLVAAIAVSSIPIPEVWFVGEVVVSLLMGSKGNELRLNRLRASGYEQVASVEARTPDGAMALHLASHGNDNPIPPEGIVR